MANVLRVLSLVAMIDSTSALSLAAPEESTMTTFAWCIVVPVALCICVGLLRVPMSLACLMIVVSLILCGCDLEQSEQQGFRLGWVISFEGDWCNQGYMSGFTLSAAIG